MWSWAGSPLPAAPARRLQSFMCAAAELLLIRLWLGQRPSQQATDYIHRVMQGEKAVMAWTDKGQAFCPRVSNMQQDGSTHSLQSTLRSPSTSGPYPISQDVGFQQMPFWLMISSIPAQLGHTAQMQLPFFNGGLQ